MTRSSPPRAPCRVRLSRAAGLIVALAMLMAGSVEGRPFAVVTAESPAGQALVGRLRRGGFVLFFRHADTAGMPCDRSYRVGDRAGQRNLSEAGRAQSRRIGEAIRSLGIPVQRPVLAGPVYRARDTAETAFGPGEVQVTDSLLADDYAGGRLAWVLAEHLRLFAERPAEGLNRVLVGHRTPAIMVLGPEVGGDAFPEGSALVLEPASSDGALPRLVGILSFAPPKGSGFHAC